MKFFLTYVFSVVFLLIFSSANAQTITPLGLSGYGHCVKNGGISYCDRIGQPLGTLTVKIKNNLPKTEEKPLELKAYPNPCTTELRLKINGLDRHNDLFSAIRITDLTGKNVYNFSGNIDSFTINTSNLKSGSYILTVVIGQKTLSTKIIKL